MHHSIFLYAGHIKRIIGFCSILLLTFDCRCAQVPLCKLQTPSTLYQSSAQITQSCSKLLQTACKKVNLLGLTKPMLTHAGYILLPITLSIYGFTLARKYLQKNPSTVTREAEESLEKVIQFNPLLEEYLGNDAPPAK
jgi:hypothetical protein